MISPPTSRATRPCRRSDHTETRAFNGSIPKMRLGTISGERINREKSDVISTFGRIGPEGLQLAGSDELWL